MLARVPTTTTGPVAGLLGFPASISCLLKNGLPHYLLLIQHLSAPTPRNDPLSFSQLPLFDVGMLEVSS